MFNPTKIPQPGKIPAYPYALLVHGAKRNDSKSGTKCLEMPVEITTESVEHEGTKVPTSGIKGSIKFWFSDKATASSVTSLGYIGFMPNQDFADIDAYIEAAIVYINTQLTGKVITAVVSSRQEPVLGPDRQPVMGHDGQPILKPWEPDFNSRGILDYPPQALVAAPY